MFNHILGDTPQWQAYSWHGMNQPEIFKVSLNMVYIYPPDIAIHGFSDRPYFHWMEDMVIFTEDFKGIILVHDF